MTLLIRFGSFGNSPSTASKTLYFIALCCLIGILSECCQFRIPLFIFGVVHPTIIPNSKALVAAPIPQKIQVCRWYSIQGGTSYPGNPTQTSQDPSGNASGQRMTIPEETRMYSSDRTVMSVKRHRQLANTSFIRTESIHQLPFMS
jgi:hypothetical protein